MLHRLTTNIKLSKWLVTILVIGLLNGLLYVFLIPPWQHYDEPTHFEYAWLIANRTGLPKLGDFDPTMRVQVAASMLENDFYRVFNFRPKLKDAAKFIGYTQLNDPPLYYIAASIPVRLLQNKSVTTQLYGARLVSLILYLAILLVGWGLMGEIVTPNHPLRWMVPITMALLPSFTDLMTAVNNNVGAVLAFSIFLWASIHLLRRGLAIIALVVVFGAAALCFWTANIAWIALPLTPVVLLFTLARGRWRPYAWGLCLVSAVIAFGAASMWGDAAVWYRRTFQAAPTRVENSLAPLGKNAFRLDLPPQRSDPVSIQQPLPPDTLADIRNEPVTLGAWVWSSRPMRIEMPALECDCGRELQVFTREIQSESTPKFFSVTAILPENARYAWVRLSTPTETDDVQGSIYYDGLVLVKGNRISQNPPRFDDSNGITGEWGGQTFINLLRNSSAEQAGPGVQSWANKIGAKILPAWPPSYPSDIFMSLLDTRGAGWYYQETFGFLFRTFWAKFGWDYVSLPGSHPYRLLVAVTLLGVVGFVSAVWRKRQEVPWEVFLVLSLALLGIWILAIIRGIGSLFGWALTPVARYAYPAILPTIFVLNVGWLEIMRSLEKWLKLMPKVKYALYFSLFTLLDALATLSIIRYYWIK